MRNMNSGYSGWSMSNRAVEAYESGAMPKSKWTKAAMVKALTVYMVDELDLTDEQLDFASSSLAKMDKAQMFERFFTWSEWHHTSKFYNATDFYKINEYDVAEFAKEPAIWCYTIKASTEHHRVSFGNFKTREAAIKHLHNLGFVKTPYCFSRGCISALVFHY